MGIGEEAEENQCFAPEGCATMTLLDISKIKHAQPAVFFTSFVSDSSGTDSASDNENLPLNLKDLSRQFELNFKLFLYQWRNLTKVKRNGNR